jgi:hypothetical protein
MAGRREIYVTTELRFQVSNIFLTAPSILGPSQKTQTYLSQTWYCLPTL